MTPDDVVQVRRSKSRATDPPPSSEFYFDLASLTKLLTAERVMQLVAAGKIDLTEEAAHYLASPMSIVADVAVQDLLDFRGGFPPHIPLKELEPFRSNPLAYVSMRRDEVLGRLIASADAFRSTDRSRRRYNNMSYVLLGELVAKFLPWERVNADLAIEGLTRTVYNPLGAGIAWENIAPTELDAWRSSRCHGVVHDETAFLLAGYAGHAGIFSTVSDIALLVQGLIANDERWALSSQIDRICRHPDSSQLGVFRSPSEYAAEAVSGVPRNAIGLTGFTGTSLWMDVDRRIGVVLLTNRVYEGRSDEWIQVARARVHQHVFNS